MRSLGTLQNCLDKLLRRGVWVMGSVTELIAECSRYQSAEEMPSQTSHQLT